MYLVKLCFGVNHNYEFVTDKQITIDLIWSFIQTVKDQFNNRTFSLETNRQYPAIAMTQQNNDAKQWVVIGDINGNVASRDNYFVNYRDVYMFNG